ncbi:MAG: pyruvate dehydrogenase complex dihydrolipoamide acetyltransferase [Bauldia sp.]|uniref:pyruvate dehydrogenase complex dihydrolipoamide acetyltransferase n=1 Tax=Bauldia sp. TaxID=2575872 RepID=UPI001DB9BA8D|nr:pyruvate dehydrogenase complex dihydrolipoamide acetyltransferase [Bauldia sp.]MCB1497084.1 pyruvate dehydrogenase complex dihydrolipoamide acetyltransferase [Bauldia sp.]
MPINILMPALSPTMEAGNLAKWLKKEGDPIKAGDVIAEIETDKATMEVEAVDEGTLGKIVVAEGTQDVPVNETIAVLLEEGEDASAIKDAGAAPAPKAAKAPEPKAAPAPEPAKGPEPAKAPPAPKAAAPAPAPTAANGGGARVFASPLARRMATESGIDLSRISGSGPHGRVIKADIEAAASGKAPLAAPAPAGRPPAAPPSMSDEQVMKLFEEGSYDVVPHDNVRKIIAKRLTEAKTTIPHFYLSVDAEIDELLKLRAEINAAAPVGEGDKPAWKVSVNDMVIKAMAMALQRVPDANVTWTEGGMLRHRRSDIGVAVSIPGGLITPVVRHAETKRLSEISNEMKDLAARARTRKLAPEEYQGGTTAISNLGMFGIKDFAAVINPPHASILAVGAGIETPVVRDGKVEVRTIMTMTLSTDHRAVDGALGAKLINAVKTLIEKPAGMMA